MRQHLLIGFGIALAAIGTPRDASAQYGYGWGGWGGSTVQGDIGRGLGAFSAGVGQGNLENAQAASINTDSVMRWNQAVWESQHALNVSNYLMRQQRQATNDKAQAEIYDRLRNHPETRDIQDGDSLNVLLDILQHPEVFRTAYKQTRTPLPREVIQDIPFEFASEGMTICLDRITTKEGWPLALNTDDFAKDRDAVKKAINAALEEDKQGDLHPRSIQAIADAVKMLRVHFEKAVPTNSDDYIPARDYIKSLAGLTKMLHSTNVDQILAELEKYQGSTVGDLLAFMQAFNLRFAPAKSFRQRQIYMQLYPTLADAVNGPLSGVAQNVERGAGGVVSSAESAASKVGNAASSFFNSLSWDHLTGGGSSSSQ